MAEFPTIATIFIKILKLVSSKERKSCSKFTYNIFNFFQISTIDDLRLNVRFPLLSKRTLSQG
jgi:hypothetical protein